jgi:hypothetical protein
MHDHDRMYRMLLWVVRITRDCAVVVIPGQRWEDTFEPPHDTDSEMWTDADGRAHVVFRIPTERIPFRVRSGGFALAEVNLHARTPGEVRFERWEEAPEPEERGF